MGALEQLLLLVAGTFLALYLSGAFHIIDTGYIGVYKRGGALLSAWTEPGLHFMIPFLTKYHEVQVTLQTDQVTSIPVSADPLSAARAAESS
jgi:regulator of protease activity HflC (stomatin/prohibitin superfamily)